MIRLGLQLTLHSGREAFTRLLLTTVAVALGVAVLLGVFAEFHAFQADANRSCWECTQGATVPKALPRRGELWNYSVDFYQGRTIERLDVAALGPGAPVPPGVSRLPGSRPVLRLPRAGARCCARSRVTSWATASPAPCSATIGDAALSGPDELAIYVGYQPSSLAAVPGTQLVTTLQGTPGPEVFTPFFRYAFGVGVLAVLFPVLILIGTATRLAAARREERFAALRLVGATPRDINVIASVDSVVSAFFGAVARDRPVPGDPARAGRRGAHRHQVLRRHGEPRPPGCTSPCWSRCRPRRRSRRWPRCAGCGSRRSASAGGPPPPPPSAWRLATLGAGVALFVAGLLATTHKSIGSPAYPGLLIVMIGLVIAGPWLTAAAARWCARVFNGASPLLATRRLADNPKAAFRAVRGLVLAVFLGTIVGALVPAVETFSATPNAAALNNVLLDTFDNTQSTGPGPFCAPRCPRRSGRIRLRRHGRRGRGGAGRARPAGRREAGQRPARHRRDDGLPLLPPAAGGQPELPGSVHRRGQLLGDAEPRRARAVRAGPAGRAGHGRQTCSTATTRTTAPRRSSTRAIPPTPGAWPRCRCRRSWSG